MTFFSCFLTYSLTMYVSEKIKKNSILTHHNMLTAVISSSIALILTLLIIFSVFKIYYHIYSNYDNLVGKIESILQQAGDVIPFIKAYLPNNPHELMILGKTWLTDHTNQISTFSKEGITGIVNLVLGIVLGIMLALHSWTPSKSQLLSELSNRFANLYEAWNKVVYSQVQISIINTILTAIYLYGLKLFGVELMYVKSMIFIAFFFGLIPVVGNILSNTIVVIISLGNSFYTALISLIFLIFIHKLEYFINARIIGKKIKAHIWEMLIAMFALEAVFGLTGFILAPILYAYLKKELRDGNLID